MLLGLEIPSFHGGHVDLMGVLWNIYGILCWNIGFQWL